MDNKLKERINAIKPYYKSFLMTDDGAVVCVRFKEGWKVASPESIMKNYKVQFMAKNDGTCLFGVKSDGDYDSAFNCIDAIIKYNVDNEEKIALLTKYRKELETMFKQEPLERFRRLTITIPEEAARRGRPPKKETANATTVDEVMRENAEEEETVVKVEIVDGDEMFDQSTTTSNDNTEAVAPTMEETVAVTSTTPKGQKKGNSLVNKMKNIVK